MTAPTTPINPAAALREALCARHDFDPPCEVIDLHHPDIHLCLGAWRNGYSLWWTDNVANDSTEWYPTLALALARTAALMHCGERGWTPCFSSAPFTTTAHRFFEEVTQ